MSEALLAAKRYLEQIQQASIDDDDPIEIPEALGQGLEHAASAAKGELDCEPISVSTSICLLLTNDSYSRASKILVNKHQLAIRRSPHHSIQAAFSLHPPRNS